MPAFSFQPRFIPALENGLALRAGTPLPHPGVRHKVQTIRAERKDGRVPAKVGDVLKLYTGMRTKACRKLGEARCTDVDYIRLARERSYSPAVWKHEDVFARADGFESYPEMLSWFERVHWLPFEGWLVRW